MRVANLSGRLVIVDGNGAVDVETLSGGVFSSDPQAIFDRWDEFLAWAGTADLSGAAPLDTALLRAPTPQPRQIFAIGLNYRDHATEVGQYTSELPIVFTKFVSSITGPYSDVPHPGGELDWEAELVVVIGREGRNVAAADAWDHVAGLTAGQDLSERITQHQGATPQFSLGKSFPAFTPIGPWVVTPDEFVDRELLQLQTIVNGETRQDGSTANMVASVTGLIVALSKVLTLLPGDIIFTGTPSGVGLGMKPPQFLSVGDEVVTRIDGIGELRNRIVSAD